MWMNWQAVEPFCGQNGSTPGQAEESASHIFWFPDFGSSMRSESAEHDTLTNDYHFFDVLG